MGVQTCALPILIVDTKAIFDVDDRRKHELIKAQHPGLDIRFVFSRSKSPIRKGSKTTYADWFAKRGIPFTDKLVPQEWAEEPNDPTSQEALRLAAAGQREPGEHTKNGKRTCREKEVR